MDINIMATISRDAEQPFSFHPAAFASYQNSLKVKKKKVHPANILFLFKDLKKLIYW